MGYTRNSLLFSWTVLQTKGWRSRLGPALANAFLNHYEKLLLEECPLSFAPLFYAEYVDYILILQQSEEDYSRLTDYLSSKHPNINFTFEIEDNDCSAFLDGNMYSPEVKLSLSVHHEDTFSGLFTNRSCKTCIRKG